MSSSTAIVAFGTGAAAVAAVYALLVRKASAGSRQLSADERHRLESISIDDVWSPNIFANVPLLQDSDEEGCGAPVVKKLVLTGGPCAGKTTALARLATYLRHRGFRVFTVPEAATMLFTNGASFRDLGTMDKEIGFQVRQTLCCFPQRCADTLHAAVVPGQFAEHTSALGRHVHEAGSELWSKISFALRSWHYGRVCLSAARRLGHVRLDPPHTHIPHQFCPNVHGILFNACKHNSFAFSCSCGPYLF